MHLREWHPLMISVDVDVLVAVRRLDLSVQLLDGRLPLPWRVLHPWLVIYIVVLILSEHLVVCRGVFV